MTLRQRVLHQTVSALRSEIIPQASRLRLGECILVRLAPRFVPFGYNAAEYVMVMRDAGCLRYQEYRIRRKGDYEPRWRTLARV